MFNTYHQALSTVHLGSWLSCRVLQQCLLWLILSWIKTVFILTLCGPIRPRSPCRQRRQPLRRQRPTFAVPSWRFWGWVSVGWLQHLSRWGQSILSIHTSPAAFGDIQECRSSRLDRTCTTGEVLQSRRRPCLAAPDVWTRRQSSS